MNNNYTFIINFLQKLKKIPVVKIVKQNILNFVCLLGKKY